MRIVKLMLLLPLVAMTASPTYAAHRMKRHHMSRTVNGPTSALPNSGKRGGSTRTGGPAGGASVH